MSAPDYAAEARAALAEAQAQAPVIDAQTEYLVRQAEVGRFAERMRAAYRAHQALKP